MITFFGASVTQQKTGYAVRLKELLDNEIKIFGFGSMHIKDAGICFIDEVLQYTPEFCFIDWFSTGYKVISEDTIEYLNTIAYKFSDNSCKLIFLFLLRKEHEERIEFYNFIKKYLEDNNLFYIDMNNYFSFSEDLIRDSVHTTDFGSVEYANIIYKEFTENKAKIIIPDHIPKTKYVDIKKLEVGKTVGNHIIIGGVSNNYTIITFFLKIGPYSGIVTVNSNYHNVWDQWCNYERNNCKLNHIEPDKDGIINIKIKQDNFDTSSCKKMTTFGNKRKKLIINSIFYIGDTIEVILIK